MNISAATFATVADDELLADLIQISDEILGHGIGQTLLGAGPIRGVLFTLDEISWLGIRVERSRRRETVDQRADWNRDDQIRSRLAVTLTIGSLATRLCLQDRLKEEVGKLIDMHVGAQDDITTISPITAVRATLGNEFLSSEAG